MLRRAVGSIEPTTQAMWVWNSSLRKLENREVTFCPALLKIFDEILVNAADNKQRDPSMDRLDVVVEPASARISVRNTGASVPVVVHAEHGIYVPELIFGHLLTSSNYDDDEKKGERRRRRCCCWL